jgi:hypothetical protein
MDGEKYEILTRNSTEQCLRLKRLGERETGHEQINVRSRTMEMNPIPLHSLQQQQ